MHLFCYTPKNSSAILKKGVHSFPLHVSRFRGLQQVAFAKKAFLLALGGNFRVSTFVGVGFTSTHDPSSGGAGTARVHFQGHRDRFAEGILNIDVIFRTGFEENDFSTAFLQFVALHLTFFDFDTTFTFHITFVPDQDEGKLGRALVDLKDLFVELVDLFKGFVVVN